MSERNIKIQIPMAFEGGGVRGTAYIGALKALEELGIYPSALSGCSAGAIIAALSASGFTADEMLILMKDKDFREFLDPVCRIPILRLLITYLQKGCFKGDNFHSWIESNLRTKLKKSCSGSSPNFGNIAIPLLITATNITQKEILVASQENTKYLPLSSAVRMSMSLPFIFKPVRILNSEIVDGAFVNNFPLKELRELIPHKLILGFRLQTKEDFSCSKGWFDLLGRLLGSAIKTASDSQEFTVNDAYIIHLPTLGVGLADFHLSTEKKMQIYQAGYDATLAYFLSEEGQEFIERLESSTTSLWKYPAP